MTGADVIAKVKTLGLAEGSYVVFGAGPLAALGIREVNDIDMLVSPEVHQALAAAGWPKDVKGPQDEPLVHECFEAHATWGFSSYAPTLTELLSRAITVDGVQFASLEDVRKWKNAWGRPKDLADVKLIDEYLAAS